jgi:hypothetical protein
MMIAGKESGNIVGVRGWRHSLLAKDQKNDEFRKGENQHRLFIETKSKHPHPVCG